MSLLRTARVILFLRVLDPVDAASYSYEDRLRLLGEVHGRIAAALLPRVGGR